VGFSVGWVTCAGKSRKGMRMYDGWTEEEEQEGGGIGVITAIHG